MNKRALITGITGQDGSYAAEFLLGHGYEVHALIRRASTFNTHRLNHIYEDPHSPDARLFLHYGDLSGDEQITNLIYEIAPEEIYHFGAQSHVRVSFDIPQYTGDVSGLATTRVLQAIRRSGIKCRFFQASSSEMFGNAPPPQNENTPFRPRSPYGAAKLYAYWITVNYREAYGLFACNGIMFNHESPRRGETFVTRKITRAVAHILSGKQKKIYLGNLDGKRDWGYAPEYIEGLWRILQQETPEDYVLGTGESHSVRDFISEAFGYAGLDWREHVEVDARYCRPSEIDCLQADASKARLRIGWEPKICFRDLVKIMVDADLVEAGLQPVGEGNRVLIEKLGKKWHSGFASARLTEVAGGEQV
jgi:GDPmannose 4,6-dehydratase